MSTHAKFATFAFTQLDGIVSIVPDLLPGSDSLSGVKVGKVAMMLINASMDLSRGCHFKNSGLEFGNDRGTVELKSPGIRPDKQG